MAAYIGLALGLGAIVAGNIIEGGNVHHLLQVAAALIVFGGTIGATLLSFSFADIGYALKAVRKAFNSGTHVSTGIINEIIRVLEKSRKNGIVSIETEINRLSSPFLKKGLSFLLDGMSPALIKGVLYQEIATHEAKMRNAARVFESAGGFAPTLGIVGAVLGLIQVMQNVTDPSLIGKGIAVAFVATIYGVGSANLVFLPISKKIMNRLDEEVFLMELVVEGVLGVESGTNPHYLRTKLNSFVDSQAIVGEKKKVRR